MIAIERPAHDATPGTFSVRGQLLLGNQLAFGAIVVTNGRIVELERDIRDESLPAPIFEAPIIAPGFIDVQVNGGFGVEIGDDPEAIRHLSARLPQTGVTAFLPTVITSPVAFYARAYAAFAVAKDAAGAHPLGLHFEGPFLSLERKGAHDAALIQAADPSMLERILHGEGLRLMTLAPERLGALASIRTLRQNGVVVSLGHTNASYEAFERGVDAGACMATHLYNAMSPFGHREPGAMGAALVDDRVVVGLIADGVHSHPASVVLAVKAKGVERIVLVTDMMSGAGMPPGMYPLGGQPVMVDGISARTGTGTLAGSIITMDQAIRNMVAWAGVAPAQALMMASANPAKSLGIEHMGQIRVGCDADLVLLDDTLHVVATIVKGQIVYRRAD